MGLGSGGRLPQHIDFADCETGRVQARMVARRERSPARSQPFPISTTSLPVTIKVAGVPIDDQRPVSQRKVASEK